MGEENFVLSESKFGDVASQAVWKELRTFGEEQEVSREADKQSND